MIIHKNSHKTIDNEYLLVYNMNRRINEEKVKQIETLLSNGISMQLIPTKDSLAIRCFRDTLGKAEHHLDKKWLEVIETILTNGDRVELVPCNGHIRVMLIKRKEVKIK